MFSCYLRDYDGDTRFSFHVRAVVVFFDAIRDFFRSTALRSKALLSFYSLFHSRACRSSALLSALHSQLSTLSSPPLALHLQLSLHPQLSTLSSPPSALHPQLSISSSLSTLSSPSSAPPALHPQLPQLSTLSSPSSPSPAPQLSILYSLSTVTMLRRCTKCAQSREFSFFQPRVATTNENKLLRTCSVCREKNRRHVNTYRQRAATTGQRPQESVFLPTGAPLPGFPPPDLPPELFLPNLPPRRLRRLSVESDASFQHEYGFAAYVELDENSIPLAFVHPANNIHRTKRLDLGNMTRECEHCHALHWPCERLRESALTSTTFEKCCKKGIVPLSPFQDPPADLQRLLAGNGQQEKEFRRNIRQYNAALTFTSMGYVADARTTSRHGPNSFQVHGEVYHTQGPLEADSPENARYAQLFFYDPDYAADLRHQRNPGLDREIMGDLSQMLEDYNPYIAVYRTAGERLRSIPGDSDGSKILLDTRLSLVIEQGADQRRHNLPVADEVAVIMLGEETGEPTRRDIQLQMRGTAENPSGCKRINQNHASYMALHYVLLFPHGDPGWHWGMELLDPDRERKRLDQRVFYRYHLHFRPNQFNKIFRCERLFQQYVVDAWAVVDQNKLDWIRGHQDELRADVYNGLEDSLTRDDVEAGRIGRRVVLPSSYTGGDRYMQQRYQNAMAINRYLGKPTLFITMTANPRWPEITRKLLPNQTTFDRPDIVSRIFHLKVQFLLNDLKKSQIFGRYAGSVYTIEYQKRGLPHLHLLLFLHPDDRARFRNTETIDQIISAEFPSVEDDPDGKLFDVVSSVMVHGPCGEYNQKASCMVKEADGRIRCSKQFPKTYQETTVVQENGYPFYRRRLNHSRTHTIPDRRFPGARYEVTNQWIVPHNPYLSRRYQAHINVEFCGSVKAIKYIHKYVYKGSDQATLALQNSKDEVARHLQGRYIGPTEGIWRLFEFPMHEEFPPVQTLAVHLPGEQIVYFNPEFTEDEVRERMEEARSTLMAFFDYNTNHTDGRQWLYQEFPAHYVYDKQSRSWHPRKLGMSIGRMYHCNPTAGEKFYVRLLLTAVPGPQSFEYLRTVNGIQYNTFRDACIALQLVEDDQHWIHTFEEAVTYASGERLRQLFITAMTFDLGDVRVMWEKFKEHLCDDLPPRLHRYAPPLNNLEHPEWDLGLFLIHQALGRLGRSAAQFSLPPYQHLWEPVSRNRLIATELDYDPTQQATLRDQRYAQLNTQQQHAYDVIVAAVATDPQHAHFFLQGAGGTGKTFLYQALCNYFRAQGQIVLCVASSGIAAELLPGGRTSHSRFQIPLLLNENSITMMTGGSHAAELIKQAGLIIWDEVPMQNKYCFEAVHRSLCDIRGDNDHLFGGLPAILGGDWAQILPVVRHGSRAAIVQMCLQHSFLWGNFRMLTLTTNMRLHTDVLGSSHNAQYAEWLSKLSYDPSLRGSIPLPGYVSQVSQLDELYEKVFPRSELYNHDSSDFWRSRAILTPFNEAVVAMNTELLLRFVGEDYEFFSEDSADYENDDGYEESTENLQQLETAGLPSSKLHLKLGAPVMLLRNIDQPGGLNNGSRLILTRIGRYCLEGRLLGGDHDGELKLIPRIPLTSVEGELPFILTRRQFPVRLCFAMTINKSQGQSLNTVGLDLRLPVFCHGQLYVALSRVTDVSRMTVLLSEQSGGKTENIVYPEVLEAVQPVAGREEDEFGSEADFVQVLEAMRP